MFNDMRDSLDDDFGEEEEPQVEFNINFDEIEAQQARANAAPERGFLGMTAGERAFLSMMIFFIVLIFGAAVLAITGRLML